MAVVGRILRSADFERVLAIAPRSRSAHFAAHHLLASPAGPKPWARPALPSKLSTGDAPTCPPLVDDLSTAAAAPVLVGPCESPNPAVTGRWLGLVVPKRHARRAVTRSLLKRQMRAVASELGEDLPPGLWVLRLRFGFDRQRFISASSAALRTEVRSELQRLMGRALGRSSGAAP